MKRTAVALSMCAVLLLAVLVSGCGGSSGDSSSSSSGESTESSSSGSSGAGGSETETSDSSKPLEGKKIGVTPYWLDASNTIYTNFAKEKLEELGADVTVLNPNGDAVKQGEEIQSFITGGYDAVIYCPVNPGQEVATLRRLQEADIPTVLFWNLVKESEMEGLKAPQFELNNEETYKELGEQAVEYVQKEMKLEPKAIIFDEPANPVLHARAEGFEKGMKAVDPNAEVLFRDSVEFTPSAARAKMADLITTYPEFNIVSPSNGEAASGAWSALVAAGRGKAKDKKAETEWFAMGDPNTQRMEQFIDPSTSVEAMSSPNFKVGGEEIGEKTAELMQDPNWKESTGLYRVPGVLLSTECSKAVKEYAEQNSSLDEYKPITCP